MLADLWCIEGEVPRYCPPNCTLILWADQGTFDLLPIMHFKISQNGGCFISSIQMYDISFQNIIKIEHEVRLVVLLEIFNSKVSFHNHSHNQLRI